MVTRRGLLALPAVLSIPASPDYRLEAVDRDRVVLLCGRERDGLILPAARVRLLPALRLEGNILAALAFGVDLPDGVQNDLLALATLPADRPPRLVALEVLSRTDPAGTQLVTRCSATSDEGRIKLERTGAAKRGPTLVTRSGWIDYLRWASGAPLTDAPIHPQPAGSWAGDLASKRVRVRIALQADVAEVTHAVLDDMHLLTPFKP